MRCPKCGYTSFDYLDACRKCGGDLREVRSLLQIIAVSPDQRGAMVGPSVAVPEEPPPAPDYAYAGPAADLSEFSSSAESSEGETGSLSDLNFDESFADMVEPTSYSDSTPTAAPAPAAASKKDEDEGLLDIDFGDVFGDKDDGKP